MWSPVFEKMFTSEFVEKEAKEIALPGKKAEEVEILLKIIYSHGKEQRVTGTYFSLPLPPPPSLLWASALILTPSPPFLSSDS